ncbi:MAG: peroxidase family protein [Chitinophagales bacterium]
MKTLISSSTLYRLVQSSVYAIVCLLIGLNLVNAQTNKAAKKVQKHTELQSFMHIPRTNNKALTCENSPYRTIDGTCNNPANTEWGATDIQLMRTMTTDYSYPDTWNDMAGSDRLSPRAISNYVVAQSESTPSLRNLSSFVFTWGQFIDHDIDLTPEGETEYEPVQMPEDEPLFTASIPFFRSEIHEGTGETNFRQQTNLITSWIDASNVYGSEQTRADWLRTFVDGKLKTSTGDLLPFNTIDGEHESNMDENAPSMAGDGGGTNKVFVAGDVRANEQPGLTVLHTLFVREHNRICKQLKQNGMNDDEEMYQIARKRVGAYLQAITYREFLPALGIQLTPYQNYRPHVQPDISNLFATAAYRLGHTMVTEELLLLDNQCEDIEDGSVSLLEGFFNPDVVKTYGLDPLLKGLSVQVQEAVDLQIIDNLRNFLFGDPTAEVVFGLDLASLNIQRGRDHGLPDYNSIRKQYTGKRANKFRDITKNHALSTALSNAYIKDIENIDAWVGLLAEDKLRNSSVGPTLHAILKSQFERLRDGDAFYYEYDKKLTNNERQDIRRTRLSDIIVRNSEVVNIADNVFFARGCNNDGGGNGGGRPHRGLGRSTANGFGGNKTGFALQENISKLQVFPNPNNGVFQIGFTIAETTDLQVELVGLNGNVVYRTQEYDWSGTYSQSLQLENIPSGIYILAVTTNSGQLTEKLVVH